MEVAALLEVQFCKLFAAQKAALNAAQKAALEVADRAQVILDEFVELVRVLASIAILLGILTRRWYDSNVVPVTDLVQEALDETPWAVMAAVQRLDDTIDQAQVAATDAAIVVIEKAVIVIGKLIPVLYVAAVIAVGVKVSIVKAWPVIVRVWLACKEALTGI